MGYTRRPFKYGRHVKTYFNKTHHHENELWLFYNLNIIKYIKILYYYT